jgi:hypothetical protein
LLQAAVERDRSSVSRVQLGDQAGYDVQQALVSADLRFGPGDA